MQISEQGFGMKYGFVKVLPVFAALAVSACVSDTLSQQNTQPLAQNQQPSYDPVQREQAVSEIRAKSAEPGSGELTNVFADPDGPNAPIPSSEQAGKIAELEADAAANAAAIEDEELQSKQDSIKQLRKEAGSHYKDALKRIEN